MENHKNTRPVFQEVEKKSTDTSRSSNQKTSKINKLFRQGIPLRDMMLISEILRPKF